jgi:hypothetical protein
MFRFLSPLVAASVTAQCIASSVLAPPEISVTDSAGTVLTSGVLSNVGSWGYLPPLPPSPPKARLLAVGSSHAIVMREDNVLVGWGYDISGQASSPAELGPVAALSGGSSFSLALRPAGTVWGWGFHHESRLPAPLLSDVVAISAGERHSMALHRGGTVSIWGGNLRGERNMPSGLTNIIAISAGGYHSLALRSDGTVVAWGNDSNGQCSGPASMRDVVAISAGQWQSGVILKDGSARVWPTYLVNQGNHTHIPPASLRDCVSISAGGYGVMVCRRGGAVVGWGTNEGVVPLGLSGVVSVDAGYVRAVAMHADGSLTNWDDPAYYTLWRRMPETLAPTDPQSYEVYSHLGYIKNSGLLPLRDITATIEGPDASQFSHLLTQTDIIAPGGSSAFAVRFHPNPLRAGPVSASLVMRSSNADPFVIPLGGVAVQPWRAVANHLTTGADFTYSPMRVERQTGLILQRLSFSNPTSILFQAVSLRVSGLAAGVSLIGSHPTESPGILEVIYPEPVAPGERVSFDLVYYDPKRRVSPAQRPAIEATALYTPLQPLPLEAGELLPVQRITRVSAGNLLQWRSQPAGHYIVEYSEDSGTSWQRATHEIVATGSYCFWVDRGPVETRRLRAPRQYRIRKVSETRATE